MSDDPRIREYFDYLLEMYKECKEKAEASDIYHDYLYYICEAEGLSKAIDTLKSTFELGEYAQQNEQNKKAA